MWGENRHGNLSTHSRDGDGVKPPTKNAPQAPATTSQRPRTATPPHLPTPAHVRPAPCEFAAHMLWPPHEDLSVVCAVVTLSPCLNRYAADMHRLGSKDIWLCPVCVSCLTPPLLRFPSNLSLAHPTALICCASSTSPVAGNGRIGREQDITSLQHSRAPQHSRASHVPVHRHANPRSENEWPVSPPL